MKKNQYHSKTIICPFYKKEEKQVIYCCGILPNTSTHIAFGNALESSRYKCDKCRKNYESCLIYQMLSHTQEENK